ncbi:hypothetical protein H633G_10726, partial [Metarhizium anisopliae BRIP 53284]
MSISRNCLISNKPLEDSLPSAVWANRLDDGARLREGNETPPPPPSRLSLLVNISLLRRFRPQSALFSRIAAFLLRFVEGRDAPIEPAGCAYYVITGSRWASLARDPGWPPLYMGTIPEHFAQIVSLHGDRAAVITRSPTPAAFETTLTYYMLDLLSNRLASSLASLGVKKGDRVAISQGNTPEFAALTYACFKLGAVLVPLNPSFNAAQVEAALKHLAAEVLIMGAVTDLAYKPGQGRSNEELLTSIAGDLRASTPQSEGVPSLKRIIVVDNRVSHQDVRFKLDECRALTPYRALLDGSDRSVIPSAPLDATDTINIQFTSGTTSMPKAAMLSHRSILNNGIFIAHRMGLEPADRIVVPPPLFHCFGCILGYMATATTGSAILFPSPAFDPVATLRMCADHDATGLYGVSTMLVAVLEALDAGA